MVEEPIAESVFVEVRGPTPELAQMSASKFQIWTRVRRALLEMSEYDGAGL